VGYARLCCDVGCLNCRGKLESKFPAEANCVRDNAYFAAAVFRNTIKATPFSVRDVLVHNV